MASPTENSSRTSKKPHFLNPCLTSIDGFQAHQNRSTPSHQDLKFLPFSVSFNGWRFANKKFKSWTRKMAALHEPIWRKAGIFEAVMSSTYRIRQNADLVLGISEKWCPDTNTFVFPWGETTITLEDVMVLLGFSVLGSPVFATLDSSGEKIMEKLEKELKKIRKDKVKLVTQVIWMGRFMDSGDELEHVAFLFLWLNYFVFPSRFYQLSNAILPIAVHLSSGTRMALAPAVLAHLYADLSLLKNHITTFNESTKIDLSSLFKLVQVWTWERFKELQPKPNPLLKGEPRLALWHDLKQRTCDARRTLDNSKVDSFEWRPYTKTLENWEFPQFYPEEGMWIPVSSSLDDVFISFARCIKVSELVGTYSVEHYFPDRVASQFGMLQDVPCPANRNSLSQEAAWNDYNKPVDDLTLYIPSRSALPCVTPVFCEWWRKSFPGFKYYSAKNLVVESAETFKERTIIDDDDSYVPSDSIMNSTSKDGMKIAEVLYKKRKYMKRASENDEITMGRCQTMVPSENDEIDGRLTSAQMVGPNKKKYSGVKNTSEPLGKKSRLEVDNNDLGPCQKLASISDDGDETVPPPKIEQRNEATNETGSKEGTNVVSLPETRKTCDDELDVNESNGDMINDGSKQPNCLLHEESIIAGEKVSSDEKLCSSEGEKEDDVFVDDDSLIQKKLALEELALKADNNEPNPHPKVASGDTNGDETRRAYKSKVLSPSDESNIHIAIGEGSQVHDCLHHDNALASKETMKFNEQIEDSEKRNNDFGVGDVDNDYNEKRFQELKVLASSIEERILKAERTVALLQERRAIKQRKLAAARWV